MLGMVSCSSCSKENQVNPNVPTPVVDAGTDVEIPVSKTEIISGSNWSFVMPIGWNKETNSAPTVEATLFNKDKHNLVLFMVEPFQGTYEEYVLLALRSIKDTNANLVSAKQVEINKLKYLLIEATKGGTVMYSWVYFKNNQGYSLSCGGKVEEDNLDICMSIANSLVIN